MLRTIAAVLSSPCGPVAIEPFSVPPPGPGEVRLRMEACGLCHSDLHVAGTQRLPVAPLVLGHEGIGRVESIGEGVEGFARGDRVGATFLASTCGECEFCRTGRERYCPRQENTGYTRHGLLAAYAVVPVQHLVRVPEGLQPEEAAPLCCAGWSGWSAIRQTGLVAGQTVALFGMGGLGHLGVQYARERGLKVAAIDVSAPKLVLARDLGAEIVLLAQNSGRALLKRHGGVDAAVVFTASAQAVQEAFQALKRGGALILVGLSTERPELPVFESVLKGITIRGSYLGTRRDLAHVFELAARGIGRPQVEVYELAETPRVLDRLRDGEVIGRAVVRF